MFRRRGIIGGVRFCLPLLLAVGLATSGAWGAQFSSDYEAKEFLRELGFRSFIQNAELLIVTSGQIEGKGGICIDLPIFGFVYENDISILSYCARAERYSSGTILIKANVYQISCAYGNLNGRNRLIVGKNLRDIANWLAR